MSSAAIILPKEALKPNGLLYLPAQWVYNQWVYQALPTSNLLL